MNKQLLLALSFGFLLFGINKTIRATTRTTPTRTTRILAIELLAAIEKLSYFDMANLLEEGADINNIYTVISGTYCTIIAGDYFTILELAILLKNTKLLEFLFNREANVNTKDPKGNTILTRNCIAYSKKIHEKANTDKEFTIINFLLGHPSAITNTIDTTWNKNLLEFLLKHAVYYKLKEMKEQFDQPKIIDHQTLQKIIITADLPHQIDAQQQAEETAKK